MLIYIARQSQILHDVRPGMESILVSLYRRGQKGRFEELLVCRPFTMTASAAASGVPSMDTQAQRRYPSWKQLFRPWAVGFIGLAIVVALWGFGYKLSLYHRHAEPSARVLVAKMWIETRNPSATTASVSEAKSHLFPGSQALFVLVQERPRLNRAVAHCLPLTARCIEYLVSLIPSRSPPPHRFGLA
jgi:hypothetical protein